jgi:hypothetical protein
VSSHTAPTLSPRLSASTLNAVAPIPAIAAQNTNRTTRFMALHEEQRVSASAVCETREPA